MNKIIIATFAIVALVACKNANSNQELTAQVENLQKWIDSVKTANSVYDSASWVALEGQYTAASANLTANQANLKDEEKAKLEASQKSWEDYKTEYIVKMTEAKQAQLVQNTGYNAEAKVIFAKTIFGEVAMANELDFSWVNASNILSTYNGFYEKFKANRETYNVDELAYVKSLYEALDSRKNEVEKEKEFKTSDNMKIAQTKVKFATLFSIAKVGAKSEDIK